MRYITKNSIPEEKRRCVKTECVYNEDYICDEPRINRGNGDAVCHRVRPRVVLTWLFDEQ